MPAEKWSSIWDLATKPDSPLHAEVSPHSTIPGESAIRKLSEKRTRAVEILDKCTLRLLREGQARLDLSRAPIHSLVVAHQRVIAACLNSFTSWLQASKTFAMTHLGRHGRRTRSELRPVVRGFRNGMLLQPCSSMTDRKWIALAGINQASPFELRKAAAHESEQRRAQAQQEHDRVQSQSNDSD